MAASALFALFWAAAGLLILGLLLLMRFRQLKRVSHRRAADAYRADVIPLYPAKAELVIRVGD